MAGKYLIVVDMQNDFVNGSLGTKEAQMIVPEVVKKVKEFDGTVIFTRDTHKSNYLKTQEGSQLPVEHCIADSKGWELIDELESIRRKAGWKAYSKSTFGSVDLAVDLQAEYIKHRIEAIQVIGLCTDICVVSNVLLLKAYLPEVPISVDADCCAGVTPQKHEAALETMRSCQVMIKGRERKEQML